MQFCEYILGPTIVIVNRKSAMIIDQFYEDDKRCPRILREGGGKMTPSTMALCLPILNTNPHTCQPHPSPSLPFSFWSSEFVLEY
jgi:hypothetical protein